MTPEQIKQALAEYFADALTRAVKYGDLPSDNMVDYVMSDEDSYDYGTIERAIADILKTHTIVVTLERKP